MSTTNNNIYFVMGNKKNDKGELIGNDVQIYPATREFLTNPQNLNFNFPFVQLWKTTTAPVQNTSTPPVVNLPSKAIVLFMYCKATCPYTHEAFNVLFSRFEKEVIINFFNLSLTNGIFITKNGSRVDRTTLRQVLENYKKQAKRNGIKTDYINPDTVPQFFYKDPSTNNATPIGGFDNLLPFLSRV